MNSRNRLSAALVFIACIAGIITNTALHLHDGLAVWLGLGAFIAFLEAV